MAEQEIIDLQLAAARRGQGAQATVTSPLLASRASTSRLAHFPEEVYNLAPETHLARLLKVLLGEAGAGQLRKRFLMARLQGALQSTHFYALDRFYGALFGIRRTIDERLDLDPTTATATTEQWNVQHNKDASYRSRITQFAQALTHGATPTGMELVAESLLSVDCDVYESFIQADSSYQTYGEIESQYPTYADMEGVGYGTLEGSSLARFAGNERREFQIRPKRLITAAEEYEVGRVLQRLKPTDTRFVFTSGSDVYDQIIIASVVADSNFWEVTSTVIPTSTTETYYETIMVEQPALPPEPEAEPEPLPPVQSVPQARVPLVTNQTAAWSYLDDILSVSAFFRRGPWSPLEPMPVQREGEDQIAYSALNALRHSSSVLGGRLVSDGILNYHPFSRYGLDATYYGYYTDTGVYYNRPWPFLFSDHINVSLLQDARLATQQASQERWWVTPARFNRDRTQEILEVRLNEAQPINKIDFEYHNCPCSVEVYVAGPNQGADDWVQVASNTSHYDERNWRSFLSRLSRWGRVFEPLGWTKVSANIDRADVDRVRIVMTRATNSDYFWGYYGYNSPYPMALRNLNLGYRVTRYEDIPPVALPPVTPPRQIPPPPAPVFAPVVIARTRDVLGSRTEWYAHEERASEILRSQKSWRCEPQPVNYAVVNFYLDVRQIDGEPEVIDRFFLDPTHSGPHLTIYYTNDEGEPGNLNTDWYNEATWAPIPREYTLQKGYLSLPPTSARHFKFEFTNLTAEPYDSLLAITRKVRLFPGNLVAQVRQGSAAETLPPGLAAAQQVQSPEYIDAVRTLRQDNASERVYTATEAVVVTRPDDAAAAQADSWAYGFQPWGQHGPAPRFVQAGVHHYEVVEVNHVNKVGYMVGLKDVRAYRVDFGADDDTQVYIEHFNDFRQIEPGFTWTFNRNSMTTENISNAVATSKVYASLHGVKAIQFATQQTPAKQVVYDDDFRDPANASRDWTDDSGWHRVGDAILAYNPRQHSLTVQRYAVPLERPLRAPKALLEGPVHPVFTYRDTSVVDTGASESQVGGIASMLLPLSSAGYAHVALRLTLKTALAQPLYLQLVTEEGEVVASKPITGAANESMEVIMSHRLSGVTVVRARLVQFGISDDQWEIDTLSVFDEGIVWEFSNNGGSTWHTASYLRNNQHGILTFPEPGNQLVWRVSGLRPRMALSALKIRPHYAGKQNSRLNAAQRGPNASVFDADIPIQDDPLFNDWHLPVPKGWFSAYKRLPSAGAVGAPDITEFARYYGRPSFDAPTTTTDLASRLHVNLRATTDWPDEVPFRLDTATRQGVFRRTVPDNMAAAGDSASALKLPPDPGRLVNRPIHPV